MSLSRIINFGYQGQVVGLSTPVGPVTATFDNSDWIIVPVGSSGVTIQNASTRTYAGVGSASEGAPVFAGSEPYQWQQLAVPGGWYQIVTTDGKYAWFLTSPRPNAPITLRGVSYQGNDSQWAYEPVPRAK